MRRPDKKKLDDAMRLHTEFLHEGAKVVFVNAGKRPWRQMKPGEHWALDVEKVEGAKHPQERYIGHWRVSTEPGDIGRRPSFRKPVRYFYFIHEEPRPGEAEWKYDPEKAARF